MNGEEIKPWNSGCGPAITLRLKNGPNAGLCHVYCTCGWVRDFNSAKKAKRAIEKHEEANR